MDAIQLKQTPNSIIVTFDKSVFDLNFISNLLTQIRTENLIQEANFDESVEKIGDEIKANWWSKNRQLIMDKIESIKQND